MELRNHIRSRNFAIWRMDNALTQLDKMPRFKPQNNCANIAVAAIIKVIGHDQYGEIR